MRACWGLPPDIANTWPFKYSLLCVAWRSRAKYSCGVTNDLAGDPMNRSVTRLHESARLRRPVASGGRTGSPKKLKVAGSVFRSRQKTSHGQVAILHGLGAESGSCGTSCVPSCGSSCVSPRRKPIDWAKPGNCLTAITLKKLPVTSDQTNSVLDGNWPFSRRARRKWHHPAPTARSPPLARLPVTRRPASRWGRGRALGGASIRRLCARRPSA